MSKMPAKKKSCFQITSVTQAQVAAIGATDDTESLEDPDESRTEDVSSEMYDMSRAEYEPACDRSSSEEALNNAGEPEATGVMAPSHIPHFTVLSVNPLGEFRKPGVSGSIQGGQQQPAGIGGTAASPQVAQPGATQQQAAPLTSSPGPVIVSINVSQPATVPSPGPPPATSTVSCTSRFRVIKLDHGTGEPFRRGRWMCTEFYEKESEGSVGNRTVDSARHVGATLDNAADRDSGLGLTGGSVVALATHSAQASGSSADVALSSSRMHPLETSVQQNVITRQHAVSGSGLQIALSGSKPTSVPIQLQAQPVVVSVQPTAPHSVGQNGLPQSVVHMQKSPVLPPSAQTQTYPLQQQQQLPMGHHLTGQNQTEYYQQQSGLSTGHSLSVSAGPQTVGQATSPAMPPASGQLGDVAVGGSILSGQTAPSQTAGMGSLGGSMLVGGSTLQQQSASQYAATGHTKPHSLHPASSGVQNVPAIAVSSSVPPTVPTAVPCASSAAMPKVTTSSLPPGQVTQRTTAGALGPQSLLAAGFGQVEGGGGVRKSDGVVNATLSGKDLVKPLMPESLQLAAPTVNSLFGIHIPVDGDEDSASGTNVVAIDNKIEQAMDLVKSHLMYAVREEVEVLKEQIKELYERNSVLERENAVLKSLANSEQLSQLPAQPAGGSGGPPPPPPPPQPPSQLPQQQQQQQQQGLSQPPPPTGLPPPAQPQLQHHPKAPQTQQTPHPQLDPSQQQPSVTSA
uniref:TSC22 domain family protein 2-like isoform X2 n=1 Tax=Doryrhamphus excisus TaxID=161450 RepID=UPI0025AE21A1|nr:TSC22 domain family protein 2-like isoform X2 [Doryrhamphus excisus]